jgi:hypothetical protein
MAQFSLTKYGLGKLQGSPIGPISMQARVPEPTACNNIGYLLTETGTIGLAWYDFRKKPHHAPFLLPKAGKQYGYTGDGGIFAQLACHWGRRGTHQA